MHRSRSRTGKQFILLAGVVVIPGVLLLVLGIRAFRQEQVLAERSRADARRQLAAQFGRQLSLALGQIQLQQAAAAAGNAAHPAHPAIVATAHLTGGRMQLSRRGEPVPPSRSYLAAIDQGRSAEFAGRADEATRHYRLALSRARVPAESSEARLNLARQFTRVARPDSAVAHYRAVLAVPFGITDDEQIPFALYAAERLTTIPGQHDVVAARVRERLDVAAALPRLENFLLRDIVESLGDAPASGTLRELSARHLATSAQLAALQRDLPTLLRLSASRSSSEAPLWIPYGDPLWLVSAVPVPGSADSAVLVVAAREIESRVGAELGAAPGGIPALTADPADGAESLAPAMPGLYAVVPAGPRSNGRSRLLLTTLVLLTALTVLSGHLLWRDVRRESRAAALRSRFVSAVSHELKTPLTSIRMFAEMLRMRPGDESNRDAFVDTIAGESERLTRLIDNVLHFSRIDEHRQSYHPAPTDVASVLLDAAGAMRYALEQERLRLSLDVDPAVPSVHADRDALMQALLNLLSNAVKFSPPGGEIRLQLARRNGEALISVSDEGIGIDRSEHERIFEEFYRSPAAEELGVEGTGLGLALVADVARAHGGRVDVDSVPGKGSTFTIALPAEAE